MTRQLTVEDHTHQAVKMLAAEQGLTMSELVEKAVRSYAHTSDAAFVQAFFAEHARSKPDRS